MKLVTNWTEANRIPELPPGMPQIALTEYDYANRLVEVLPPIRTIGSAWLAYRDGTWRAITRAELRPKAQSILPEAIRTARREHTLLDHLEGRFQVAADALKGVYGFEDGGAVLINAANGVVRVDMSGDWTLLAHSPDYSFTQQTRARFNPEANAPLFLRLLEEVLPDPEDRQLLQLCCGNFLLPDCRFETALVGYGEAGRGKSTIAEPIAAALGTELVSRLSMSQLCDPKSYHLPKLRFAAATWEPSWTPWRSEKVGTSRQSSQGSPSRSDRFTALRLP